MIIRPLAVGLVFLASVAASPQDFRNVFTAVTPTNFDSGGDVSRQFHLHAESYLTMATIYAPEQASELLAEPSELVANTLVSHKKGETSFADYVAQEELLDGAIVLQNGRIVFEAYPRMQPHQRHFAWSITKVVTSAALASLAERGSVDMSAPIERYLPFLAESGWAGTSVQDIADMASGIDCLDSDGYQDATTCVYTQEEALGITAPTGRAPDFIKHLQSMTRRGEPGEKYEYVSANTNVLALLIEAVAQKPYAAALQELVWQPIGAEADGLVAISDSGFVYGSGGLHARLRDIARFGQIYTQPSLSNVLSASTMHEIQNSGLELSPSQLAELTDSLGEDLPLRAGWQWDMIWSDGAMFKAGYSGQGLYVDPSRQLVVAWFGTGLDYDAISNEMLPVSRQIAQAIGSGQR